MNDTQPLLERHFAALLGSQDAALQRLLADAHCVHLPAGQPVFRAGDICQNYLLVLDGGVRVYLTTASGREVVLYHVGPGESCVITTSCLLGGDDYPAAGITEAPTIAMAISAPPFQQALALSADFRHFVFANLGQRISQMIARIEEVTVGAIDKRLALALLAAGQASGSAKTTHQQLAAELGTAREVVSRHLKHFSGLGWVRLGRGTVEIVDRAALEKLLRSEKDQN
jgi:CRP/FNR family transcriptional regulator, anaerobic regulatory protein